MAERAKAHRNKCNKAYRRAKTDFNNMQAEERKIEQITAESDDAWDMVK